MKKTFLIFLAAAFAVILTVRLSLAADSGAPAQMTFDAPNDMKVAVKMIGPYAQDTDLQIICVFKHKSDGDTYVAAMKDLDDKVGGLLSTLRNRREFVGNSGKRFSLILPPGPLCRRACSSLVSDRNLTFHWRHCGWLGVQLYAKR
jgi:hypothetical protein